jgi:hypothetical protein
LDRARVLAGLQGSQAENILGQQRNLLNLFGQTTNRPSTLEPNQAYQQLAQHPMSQFDPYKAVEVGGRLARTLAPLLSVGNYNGELI